LSKVSDCHLHRREASFITTCPLGSVPRFLIRAMYGVMLIEYGKDFQPPENRYCCRMNISNAIIGDSSIVIWQLTFSANPSPYDSNLCSPQSAVF
jgi:hypothetical protein